MKWKVIKNIIQESELSLIYEYCKQKAKEPYEHDPAHPNTPSYYNDAMIKVIHKRLGNKIAYEFDVDLWPTYCFLRMYNNGDILHEHTDRPSCEYSATLHIGHGGEGWGIILKDENLTHTVFLNSGDMLLYKGCELPHWRDEYTGGYRYAQIFLHYVNKDGPNKEWKFDKNETY